MLGGLQGMLGAFDRTEASSRRALALQPGSVEARMNLANALLPQGKLDEAATCYETVLRQQPELAAGWFMLGRTRRQQGQYGEAERCYRETIRLNPALPGAWVDLGNALRAQGKASEAVSVFREAATRPVAHAGVHYQVGCALQDLGQFNDAADCFRNALRLKPDLAEAYVRLALVLQTRSDYSGAIANCEQALRIKPDLAEAHHVLAVSFVALDSWDEAVSSFERALHIRPDYADAHLGLASVMLALGKPDQARASCEKALALDPANIDAIALAAYIAKRAGETEKAYRLLYPLVERGVLRANVAVTLATISKDLGRQFEAIALMEKTLGSDPALSDAARINLHFNLGMLYDDTKQYDRAFFHYQQGNMLKPLSFDRANFERIVEGIVAVHTPEFMARMPRARVQSDRPVFIVGMVRSGTSLVEQILSSHPDVHGAGELPDITRIARELPGILGSSDRYPGCMPGLTREIADTQATRYLDRLSRFSSSARRVTDKLPGNFMYLGLIELLFPGARVIHCRRDPVDTCLSAYFQDFSNNHPYAYDLANLGVFYRGYLKIMAHWRKVIRLPLLEINYEDLIADQERVSRSLVEFCGLEWDNRCLQFHETRRFVGTASYDQVNRPLYKQSVARWKNYERHLGPLLAELNQ
jgi:tetratricopeptide (TPR) repeat protein